MLKLPHPHLDERRKRKLMRLWWDWSSDLGEFVAVVLMLCVAVVACALFWMLVVPLWLSSE